MELLNIDIRLNAELTADSPELKDADNIIVATGALPLTPNIPGIENTIDILTAHTQPDKLKGNRIIYCGGGLSACDSALETAMSGKKVEIIEMLDEIAINDHFINKAALIPMLINNGVEIHTGHRVIEISKNGVRTQKKDGTEEFIPGDTIVSAFGMKPNNTFAKAVDSKYHLKTRIIGDSIKIGKVGGAVREGMYAALSIK
jgi:thioredoxin reductase